jgi:hypothetical protein
LKLRFPEGRNAVSIGEPGTFAPALLLLKAVAAELKGPTILGYGSNDIIGHARGNISFNFERDLH